MRDMANRISTRLALCEKAICIVSLIVMLGAVSYSVIVRNLGLFLPDATELALAAMVPLTFVGCSLLVHLGEHIVIDLHLLIKNKKFIKLLRKIATIGTLFFGVLYIYYSSLLLRAMWHSQERWLNLGILIYIPAIFYFVGMVGVVIHSLALLIKRPDQA
ncbi:TRAP transporter small permease subunit [Castellaniella sp. GW247-6E4]|uniref:TRAP transporter small permease n=1 Tax=Castellaniella sp. GW247-6E4 TaxID=3140380 RepID=UPI003314D7AE